MPVDVDNSGQRSTLAIAQIAGYLIGPAFLVLAVLFLATTKGPSIPLPGMAQVSAEDIKPGAWRTAMTDPPWVMIGGYSQRCNACHKLFKSLWDGSRPLGQHTHLKLRHGLNSACFSCHDIENRERLVLHDGSTVAYAQVAQLCAQCHGIRYRDWQLGTHGKDLGTWKTGSPAQRRLTCTECHDPHAPAYEQMSLMPGPNTLRMGLDKSGHRPERAEPRSPLRRAVRREFGAGAGASDKSAAEGDH